ncbi:hypothetical protein JCM17823_23290 [Halorubrum gandharaense]
MYLSHTVRRIREEPQPDETVGLVVELNEDAADGALDTLHETVEHAGGQVGRDLGFGAHHVAVPEPAVDELAVLDDVVRIETDATIALDVTAPEEESTENETTAEDLRDHLDGE